MNNSPPKPREDNAGLNAQQWMLLVFTFLLGIAAVFTVDKFFLSNHHPSGAAHAAVSQP